MHEQSVNLSRMPLDKSINFENTFLVPKIVMHRSGRYGPQIELACRVPFYKFRTCGTSLLETRKYIFKVHRSK